MAAELRKTRAELTQAREEREMAMRVAAEAMRMLDDDQLAELRHRLDKAGGGRWPGV